MLVRLDRPPVEQYLNVRARLGAVSHHCDDLRLSDHVMGRCRIAPVTWLCAKGGVLVLGSGSHGIGLTECLGWLEGSIVASGMTELGDRVEGTVVEFIAVCFACKQKVG